MTADSNALMKAAASRRAFGFRNFENYRRRVRALRA
jgi:hypothetical protein